MKNMFWKLALTIVCAALLRDGRAQEAAKPEEKAAKESVAQPQVEKPPAMFQAVPDKGVSLQPESVDPAKVREGMKARAEYDALTKKATARKQALYEQNPTIKKLQANMRELQKRIDEILAGDEELCRLKEKLDSVSPKMPLGIDRKEPQPIAPPAGDAGK